MAKGEANARTTLEAVRDRWTRLRARLSRLFFVLARRRLDEETRLEIDAHLDLLTERYLRQGMSPDEAYIAARRRFGNTTLTRQDIHELNSIGWIEQGVQDLRYALRQLRAQRRLRGVVVATLGLGIGGATAVFSVVQAVLLAPLPYEEPGQLVRFYQQDPGQARYTQRPGGHALHVSPRPCDGVRGRRRDRELRETGLDLFTDGRAERLRVLRVSSGYFSVLRSQPRLGRGFDRGDETGTNRVVLSDATWRTYFGGDPSIVGTTIRLSGGPYEVAGVAAARLRGSRSPRMRRHGSLTHSPATPMRRTIR